MSNATLTIPTPESCKVCPLPKYEIIWSGDNLLWCNYAKDGDGANVDECRKSRHPDCPLKIKEYISAEAAQNAYELFTKKLNNGYYDDLNDEEIERDIDALLDEQEEVVREITEREDKKANRG